MAQNRKLQEEITRTLKRVNEGIELFDEIWNKVYGAPSQTQKEKHESELKKEIKKLQRLRDQIKTWISNTDVKDKKGLVEARKEIETRMESFKQCERETKTKAYSKEGLSQPDRQGPEEAAKAWINSVIKSLQVQIEGFEADIESQGAKPKSKKKSEGNPLETWIQKHKMHIRRLECLLRLLENEDVTASDIEDTKENVENYVERNQEPEFEEQEVVIMYNGLIDDNMLEAIEEEEADTTGDGSSSQSSNKAGTGVSPPITPATAPMPPPITKEPKKEASKPKPEAAPKSQPKTPAKPTISINTNVSSSNTASSTPVSGSTTPPSNQSVRGAPVTTSTDKKGNAKAAATTSTTQPAKPTPTNSSTPRGSTTPAPPAQQPTPPRPPVVSQPSMPAKPASLATNSTPKPAASQPAPTPPHVDEWEEKAPVVDDEEEDDMNDETFGAVITAEGVGSLEEMSIQTAKVQLDKEKPKAAQATAPTMSKNWGSVGSNAPATNAAVSQSTPQPSSSPAPSTAPAPSAGDRDLHSRTNALRMLEASLKNLPQPHDGERPKPYIPPNPYRTPTYYPQTPHPVFNNPEIFSKFDTDTLFFIFYYQQATYQQFLAARELKKQSWRYHKKYLTWFQRHDQPKVTTDELEQGTYVYFDYETGWCQRIKQEFVFKYTYLEDELPV